MLPPQTEWIGSPTVVGAPSPLLAWQSFRALSLDEASAYIAQRAVPVGRTRDGNVRVFRDPNHVIFLAIYDGLPRVELVWPAPCRPLAASFPTVVDDVFRQFGSTPGRAAELAATHAADFDMEPCPTSGFWAVDLAARAALFTGFSPNRLTYRVNVNLEPAGHLIEIGPGLPKAYLRDDLSPELSWWSDGAWHTYSGEALTVGQLTATACRTMRPRILCP